VQIKLLGTVSQFACAPLLWSFWLTLAGITHPIALTMGAPFMWMMLYVFVFSALINVSISMVAVSTPAHRHLVGWVLSMPFYFPLGALAAYKGLYECIHSPFYWDKTQHGVHVPASPEEPPEIPYLFSSSRRAASCFKRVTNASEM